MSVRRGEFVAIVGPNGAGKTTLLEVVLGLLPLSSGRGSVLGCDLARERYAIRRRMGYVIQNFELDPLAPFLARDVVMMGFAGSLGPLRYPSVHDREAAVEALSRVGMSMMADRPAGKLSGGEFQRLLLARALATDPDIILLDEPFANLDASARASVGSVVDRVNQAGATVLMVSHDLHAIPSRCARAVLMDRGRIVLDGTMEAVLSSREIDELYGGCCH